MVFSSCGKVDVCICVRYICVYVSKQEHTAECNISLMAACCVYDSSCMKSLWIFVQWELIISDFFSIR